MTAFNTTSLVLMTTLISLSHNTYAACNRDDVNYYLSKGFSTEQITTLCGTASSSHTNKEPATSSKITEQNATPVNNNELFLREAIKGRNVVLANNALAYTLKVCIKYGEEDLYGFAPKACPNVRFNINLKGLTVTEPVKKLFFSPEEIEIKGTISRSVIDGLENYKAEDQALILKLLESGNKTAIPVRDDISIDKVYQTLEELTL